MAAGLALLGAGVLVAVLSAVGLFPMATLARGSAADGAISGEFIRLLCLSQWTLAACLCLVSLSLLMLGPGWARLELWFHAGSYRKSVLFASLLSFLFSLAVQQTLFDGIPHVTDAISHQFQGKILATGRLAAPAPPCPESFRMENVVISSSGLWHTKYFPGQALWLAWGVLARVPWLPMPLAQGLCTLCLGVLVRRWLSPGAARLAVWLFAFSPMLWLLAGSYMSHTTFLFAATAAAALWSLGSGAWRERSRPALLLGAGLLWGVAMLCRPQDFAAVGPVALFVAVRGLLHSFKSTAKDLLYMALGFLPALLVLGVWNWSLYGSVLATGYNFGDAGSVTRIKQDSFGLSAGFTAADSARQTAWTLLRFNKALWGWPSSLVFIPFALLASREKLIVFIAALGLAMPVLLYALFPYYGFEYEARYYALCVPFAAVLTAQGFAAISRRVTLAGRTGVGGFAAWLLRGLLAAFCLHTFLYYWPVYLRPAYSGDYEQASRVIDRSARAAGLEHAIVLIPCEGDEEFRYASGFPFNDPLLTADRLYARDGEASQRCLRRAFPDRALYRFVPEPGWTSGRLDPLPAGAPGI